MRPAVPTALKCQGTATPLSQMSFFSFYQAITKAITDVLFPPPFPRTLSLLYPPSQAIPIHLTLSLLPSVPLFAFSLILSPLSPLSAVASSGITVHICTSSALVHFPPDTS